MLSSKNRAFPAAVLAAGISAIIILTGFHAARSMRQKPCLTVKNQDTGEIYLQIPVSEADRFSVGFVHSVNKSPVIDCYEIRNEKIILDRTIYYGFGAGVQTEIEDGQTLSYGEDGSMTVSGFEQEMPDLCYLVGTVSDHILTVGYYADGARILELGTDREEPVGEDGEISLRDLCGRNAAVRLCIEQKVPQQ